MSFCFDLTIELSILGIGGKIIASLGVKLQTDWNVNH